MAIGRTDLLGTNFRLRRVCSNHFERVMYNCPDNTASSKLLPTALPTASLQSAPTSTTTSRTMQETGCQTSYGQTTEQKSTKCTQTSARYHPSRLLKEIFILKRKLRGYRFRRNRRSSEIHFSLFLVSL